MSPDEAAKAVQDQARVRFHAAWDRTETQAEGKVISYSVVPVLTIETDDGKRVSWRHDLAEIVPTEPDTRPRCPRCEGLAVPEDARYCPSCARYKPVCDYDHCMECGALT
jgi:hypothetical protein